VDWLTQSGGLAGTTAGQVFGLNRAFSMTQHYLHAKGSRNFARKINRITDDQAEQWLAMARWGSADQQGCPACGLFRKHYRRVRRRRWRCADAECAHEFSVTSGTSLHGTKLVLRDIIWLFSAFENGAKGKALLEATRRVGCTPKTAQVFFGKIREWMINTMDLRPLRGVVHIDGGYFGGKPRKPNRRVKMPKDALKVRFGKKAPTDSRKPWIEAGMTYRNWCKRAHKRVVISLCESAGSGLGSRRAMAFVCAAENETEVRRLVEQFVMPDAIVMTDENGAYSKLSAYIREHYAVSHAYEYSSAEGVSDNMCETFFSRFRRSEYGVLHGFRPKYLQDYACEFVWRQNHRRLGQEDRFRRLLDGSMTATKSTWWRGYWQGNHRVGELNLDYFLEKIKFKSH